jgi:ribose transport system substrate-binding protein
MKKRVIAVLVAVTFAASACSVGGDAGGGTTASAGANASGASTGSGLPETVQPAQMRDFIYSKMKGKRIAFIPLLFKGFKITQQWASSMQRTFDMEGANFQVYDSNFDTDLMVRTIDDLIANHKADMLIIHNPDLGVLTKQIKDAAAAGIYTIVLNMASNESGDVFIGADVITAGQELASRAITDCKATGGPTDLAVLDGPGTDGFSIAFNDGVKRAADAAGAKIVDTQHTNWQADLAASESTTLIQRHGASLCAILAPWDVIAIPAGTAVKKAESENVIPANSIGVYALDASDDGCKAISSGLIRAINAYDQPGLGAAAAIEAQRLFVTAPTPGATHTAAYVSNVMVDKTNVGQFASACYQGK